MRRNGLLIVALVALVSWTVPAAAQEWPAKPVRIMVPFAPGGAADIWARIIAEHLSPVLKQSVVVENRGGAGGMVGSAQVARAEPDGYTLLIGGLASQVIAPAINPKPLYDSLADFTYIAYIGGPPITWVVHPASELRSVADVVAAARAGKVTSYASAGVGTLGHLVVEYVQRREKIEMAHIPYTTAAFADIMAGRVPLGTFTWGAALGLAQAGKLRPVAVTTENRIKDFPDVPTFKELGYDMVASTWFALLAPKGLPASIVQRLNVEILRIMKLPEVQKRIARDAFDPTPMNPAELTAFAKAETERWRPIAHAAAKSKPAAPPPKK